MVAADVLLLAKIVDASAGVPVATRGSSASADGFLLSEQASSAAIDAEHGPKPEPEVSSGFT